jgi:hypothetical protein
MPEGWTVAQVRRLARTRSSSRASSATARTSAKTPTKIPTLRTLLPGIDNARKSPPPATPLANSGQRLGSAQQQRGSACTALAGLPAGPLHPAGPTDLLADRRIAARAPPAQGRFVPPYGPVLPSRRDALRAPLTPPGPGRSGDQRRPGWARSTPPRQQKAGEPLEP